MTNLRLLLSIGIPSLLVILSWMQTNSRLADLKESMSQRFSQTDQRFGLLDRYLEQRFGRIEQRLDQVEGRIISLENDYREFYGMEKKLEGRVDELSRR